MRKGIWAAALLLALALGVSACGGSGSDGSSTSAGSTSAGSTSAGSTSGSSSADGNGGIAGASISKAEYVKKAEAICLKVPTSYTERLGKLPKAQQNNPKQSVPKAAVPPLREASQELAALGSPQGDEQKVEEIVEALEAAADGLEKDPEAGFAGPKSPFVEFVALTKAYGLEACSRL